MGDSADGKDDGAGNLPSGAGPIRNCSRVGDIASRLDRVQGRRHDGYGRIRSHQWRNRRRGLKRKAVVRGIVRRKPPARVTRRHQVADAGDDWFQAGIVRRQHGRGTSDSFAVVDDAKTVERIHTVAGVAEIDDCVRCQIAVFGVGRRRNAAVDVNVRRSEAKGFRHGQNSERVEVNGRRRTRVRVPGIRSVNPVNAGCADMRRGCRADRRRIDRLCAVDRRPAIAVDIAAGRCADIAGTVAVSGGVQTVDKPIVVGDNDNRFVGIGSCNRVRQHVHVNDGRCGKHRRVAQNLACLWVSHIRHLKVPNNATGEAVHAVDRADRPVRCHTGNCCRDIFCAPKVDKLADQMVCRC